MFWHDVRKTSLPCLIVCYDHAFAVLDAILGVMTSSRFAHAHASLVYCIAECNDALGLLLVHWKRYKDAPAAARDQGSTSAIMRRGGDDELFQLM